MQELTFKETERVSGGIWANAAGAVGGAIGGFYGSIIAGGQDASFSDIAQGTLAGAVSGALSPVRGISSGVTSVGAGIVGGAAISVYKEIF